MEVLIIAFLALAATSTAAPVEPEASVRVSFVSPPHSYSHGLDLMPASTQYLTAHDSQLQNVQMIHSDPDPVPAVLSGAELDAFAASFMSNEPRFFHQFPHERSLLANVELRASQNLPPLRIGSIRPGSPFIRA
ncbi:uncharacterized protein LOC135944989 [Cloeon dipterum]|uniref:uncharacterized protein LOC135944989 n=1 Tax=Cloeon dipterum TaxID=197152 RepID=UPI003220451A